MLLNTKLSACPVVAGHTTSNLDVDMVQCMHSSSVAVATELANICSVVNDN